MCPSQEKLITLKNVIYTILVLVMERACIGLTLPRIKSVNSEWVFKITFEDTEEHQKSYRN